MQRISYITKFIIILCFSIFTSSEILAFNSLEEYGSYDNDPRFACNKLGKILSHDEIYALETSYATSQKEKGEPYIAIHTPLNAGIFSGAMYYARHAYSALTTSIDIIPGASNYTSSDMCANAYIVQPHEYINRANGWVDYKVIPNIGFKNAHPLAITATDVPFYYSCDPEWDPLHQSKVYYGENEKFLRGRVWGYMGAASSFCVGNAKNYALKEKIGQIRVEYANSYTPKNAKTLLHANNGKFLKAGESAVINSVKFHAYNYFDYKTGKMQLCVGTPDTQVKYKVGCTFVPPAVEVQTRPPFLDRLEGTRCYYLLQGRTDLRSLGDALPTHDQHHHDGKAIRLFLQSDFHINSTVIGCIKDMIYKVFIGAKEINKRGLLEIFHHSLRGIVFAVLVLYVSLIGIKIMSSPQVPNQGEFLMYIIKFALVIFFTSSSVWCYKHYGEARGLFPTIISTSEDIALLFFKAHVNRDPVGLCNYWFEGSDLLEHRNIMVSQFGNKVEPTIGSNYIKLTFWDLLDCKLANYLNLGSCNYSPSGMLSMWLGAASLLAGGNGFILTFISIMYVFILLLVVFRFAVTFILTCFVIALLVLVSPIIICFSLFNPTKSIFQSWFRMLIGYMLYPALLFVLLSFMITVFDSIYFGDLTSKAEDIKKHNLPITQACEGVNSIFCATIGIIAKDPCTANLGTFADKLVEPIENKALGEFKKLKPLAVEVYYNTMLRLLLFVLIFYFFIDSVNNFVSVLLGIHGFENVRGSINIASTAKNFSSVMFNNAASLTGQAIGKATGSDKVKRQ